MLKILAPLLLLCGLVSGCGGDRPAEAFQPPGDPPSAPQATIPTPPPNTLQQYEERVQQAERDRAAAIAKADRLAQLQAEKDEAQARAALSSEEAKLKAAEAKQWKEVAESKDIEIREERERLYQVKLYWLVGILGFLALAASVVAIWQPLVRKFAGGFAIACGAVAAIALFAAAFIHYLIWIGGALLALGVVAAIVYMRRSDKAVLQVATAVESVKDQIPDFKKTFSAIIDSDAEAHIDAARIWLKKQRDKVTQSTLAKKLKGE